MSYQMMEAQGKRSGMEKLQSGDLSVVYGEAVVHSLMKVCQRRFRGVAGLLVGLTVLVLLTHHTYATVLPWDLRDHWAEADVALLTAWGVVHGYEDGSFRPDLSVTRAEMAKLVVSVLADLDQFRDQGHYTPRYRDVPAEHWATSWILAASEYGVFEGYGNDRFQPDSPITRAEAAVALGRALQVLGAKGGASYPETPFTDAGDIPQWAREWVNMVFAHGLITGYPDGSFRPSIQIARSEAAVMVRRLMRWLGRDFHLFGTVTSHEGQGWRLETPSGSRLLPFIGDTLVFRNGRRLIGDIPPVFDQAGVILADSGGLAQVHLFFWAEEGVVVAVERTGGVVSLVLDVKGQTVVAPLVPGARVFRQGRPASSTDLGSGDLAYVVYDWATGSIRAVDAVRFSGHGSIRAVFSDGYVLLIEAGLQSFVIMLSPEAIIFCCGERLKPGSLVSGMVISYAIKGGLIDYLEVQRRE